MNTVLGQKKTIGQMFLENGIRIPVTGIKVSVMPVVQKKTVETDGYAAIQLGYGTRKHALKAQTGHAKKANLDSVPRILREVRVPADFSFQQTSVSVSDVLKIGDIVTVSGVSKGKGWAGGVKRWGFKGGPRTHGQSDRERAPGSIGQTTTPGRVYKGKHMAGRMGNEKVTVRNLIVMDVQDEIVLVAGLVPGIKNGLLTLEKIGEVSEKKFVPLHKVVVVEEIVAEDLQEAPESKAGEEVAEDKKTESATEDIKAEGEAA